MKYQIIANQNRHYETTNARIAADMAVTWKNNGLEPKAWKVSDSESGIVTMEVKITTKHATAKALVAA